MDTATENTINTSAEANALPKGNTTKPKAKKTKKTAKPKTAAAKKMVKAQKKAEAKVKAKKEPKEPRVTVASRCRELIKSGKDNQEVWDVVAKEFKLDDSKRHYPSWYRSQMKRAK